PVSPDGPPGDPRPPVQRPPSSRRAGGAVDDTKERRAGQYARSLPLPLPPAAPLRGKELPDQSRAFPPWLATLPVDEGQCPAARDVRLWHPAVAQNIRAEAARVFEGIRQDRQSVEGPILVDGLGEGDHVGRDPAGVDADRVEGVAEDVTDQAAKGISGA